MKREKGFTLFITIAFLALVGLTVGLLGNMSKNFADRTNRYELEVRTRQILSSGKAWVDTNFDTLAGMKAGQKVTLDTGEFSSKKPGCIIKLIKNDDNTLITEITAKTSKGKFHTSKSSEIALKKQ